MTLTAPSEALLAEGYFTTIAGGVVDERRFSQWLAAIEAAAAERATAPLLEALRDIAAEFNRDNIGPGQAAFNMVAIAEGGE